ncbi:MAG: MBL fold metallo-hydrolase [Pseudobdellovibrio sp.]
MNSREERILKSKNFKNGRFQNIEPVVNDYVYSLMRAFQKSSESRPKHEIKTQVPDFTKAFKTDDLVMTWFGHSTMLLEFSGLKVLTDPVWCERASPVQQIGPKRFYPPVMPIEKLPKLDFILLSHNHFDHLDPSAVRDLAKTGTPFITALGVGAYLEKFGVAPELITELDWWESTKVKEVEIVCTPARHFSGRSIIDSNQTLWGSWCLLSPKQRVFFSGDTGMTSSFKEIGAKHGPFDLTLIEIGAFDVAWPHVHLGPDNAWQAHQDLKGKTLFPVHWGLFDLAFHAWTQPIERLLELEKQTQLTDVKVVTRTPGERFTFNPSTTLTEWWKK